MHTTYLVYRTYYFMRSIEMICPSNEMIRCAHQLIIHPHEAFCCSYDMLLYEKKNIVLNIVSNKNTDIQVFRFSHKLGLDMSCIFYALPWARGRKTLNELDESHSQPQTVSNIKIMFYNYFCISNFKQNNALDACRKCMYYTAACSP